MTLSEAPYRVVLSGTTYEETLSQADNVIVNIYIDIINI